MEQGDKKIRTDITEENAAPPAKAKKRVWPYVVLGVLLLLVAVGVNILAMRPRQDQRPGAAADDQEQRKYDEMQGEQERRKADGIRNDPFLVRKDDDSQWQLNSLLKDLNIGKDPSELPKPMPDHQVKAEEEAIANVLRDQSPAPAAARTREPRPLSAKNASAQDPPDSDMRPMFVYSRTFRAAKYVDAPQKEAGQSIADSIPATPQNTSSESVKPDRPGALAAEQMTTLIYTEHPPVTMYEGEMLEAVLVNRIIADTEPSPVVCHIAKDVFDRTAKYVVFPANSRVVGLSQVVNYKGAHRLFISFHRIILPNGPSIDLPASKKALKALDETGAAGVVSKVERHWFLQFGTGIFFGVMDGIAGLAQRNRDIYSSGSIILGRTSENFERILENIMTQYSTIVPTIRVDQGKKMKIYLSNDILISPYAKITDHSYYAKH